MVVDIVFIPADREEYLYLLNLKRMKRIRIRQPVGGEQGWLNEVYLWEKFDIGLEFNVRTGVMQVGYYLLPVFDNHYLTNKNSFLRTRKEGWEDTCKMLLFSTLLGCSSPTIALRNTSC